MKDAIKSNSKSKFQSIFLLSLAFMLAGCQLNYPAKHKGALTIQQTTVEQDLLSLNPQQAIEVIESLNFSTYDPSELVKLRNQNHHTIYKISIDNFPSEVSEATLTLLPKYLAEVSYAQYSGTTGLSRWKTQYRHKSDSNRYFSSEKFAFNINDNEIPHTHYLLLRGTNNLHLQFELVDTQSFIKADAQFSHFLTVVYSIVLALILFNTIFYLYNRDTSYLLYIIYLTTTLYALLWQEGKINQLPALAFYFLGDRSGIFYFMVSDLAAIAFFYHFMHLSIKNSWLARLVILTVLFKIGLLLTSLLQYHVLGHFYYETISSLFNLSVIINCIAIWIILLLKTWQKYPQAKYLFFAWSILIATVFLRIYYILNPRPELIWMPHSYEIGVMLEGLILAFAMANRTMKFKTERDQAISKYAAAERSAFEHQLITDFQLETQEIAKNPTLSEDEVLEKINIKFHLLMNKAFPIQSSLIKDGDLLQTICANGLTDQDIPAIEKELVKLRNHHNQVKRFQINSTKQEKQQFLMVPLGQEAKDVLLIFGLKHSQPISQDLINDLKSYSQISYTALLQAFKTHKVALAANLDSMTQIHNRGSIEKVIESSLKNHSRTTVAYIDLDDLKDINDKYGHHIGDQCIIELVETLAKELESMAKLGRIGGDEFIAVFSDIELERSEAMFEHLFEIINTAKFSESSLKITLSIGLAESRIYETKESLLKKADVALYHAKKLGKNQLVEYEPRLETE